MEPNKRLMPIHKDRSVLWLCVIDKSEALTNISLNRKPPVSRAQEQRLVFNNVDVPAHPVAPPIR